MARKPRLDLAGFPQHVVQRGNDRRPCFLDDDDRCEYMHRLGVCATRSGVAIHAYVLVGNHVHLLATPEATGAIPRLMQGLGATYVRAFNTRHGRTGTLWEGRYRSCTIDTDSYLWACHRYIELNPVRAGMCASPSDYRWSSFACNALGHTDRIVTPHSHYWGLGSSPSLRAGRYAEFFRTQLGADIVEEIREHTRRELAYGDPAFVDSLGALSGRGCCPLRRGRKPQVPPELTCSDP